MSGPSPNASIDSVARPQRIKSIDVLRGFALLGILVMNIQSFSMIDAAYFNPTAYGELTGLNYWVWLLSHVLADQKFMTIFSMLYGAGILLMSERIESRGERPAFRHYRRTGWLIVFGLLHGYLLWSGDILFLYGVCGLVVYLLRKLSPRSLLILGVLSLAVSSGLYLLAGWSMDSWGQAEIESFREDSWQPSAANVQQEIDLFQSGWLEQMQQRFWDTLYMQTFVLAIWGVWRAGGLMLMGMALFKLGVFSARRSSGFYVRCVLLGLTIGVPVVLYGVHQNFQQAWDIQYSFFLGWQYNYWGSVLVALGWIGLVMLVCQSGILSRLTASLAAVGQMALTNYLLHTIICTTIFYGHGFGLFGQVERTGQAAIVVTIWVFQLVASPLWLLHFRFGPFEWLWRSLTYGCWQPLRQA